MYISDTLESQVLLSGNNGLEFLLVSVYDASKPTQKLHVGVWYRPPHDREEIENLFESLDVLLLYFEFLNQEHPLLSKQLRSNSSGLVPYSRVSQRKRNTY